MHGWVKIIYFPYSLTSVCVTVVIYNLGRNNK